MKRFTTLSLLVVLVLATQASAEPIETRQILGGTFLTDVSFIGQFSLFGSDFNLQGNVDLSNGRVGCSPACTGGQAETLIRRGEIFNLSGTVDGVTYSHLFLSGFVTSVLSVGGSVFVPLDAVTGTQLSFPFVTSPEPFQIPSRFIGYTVAPGDTTPPAFAFNVSGSGTAVMTLQLLGQLADGSGFYRPTSINWTFEPPSPVPEPTSIVLLGTGLAAAVLRRSRARVRP